MLQSRWWSRRPAHPAPAPLDEDPLQFELFNLEQLEAHARTLASTHVVQERGGVDKLLPRLRANERHIRETCVTLGAAQGPAQRNSPAGEWLLDNVHVIEEQIGITRRHLPKGYSRALPHLTAGPFVGYPRVYNLALEVIAHVDGRIDRDNVSRFVAAYQQVSPLSLAELWAVPIMLRLALIENLRRVAVRVKLAIAQRLLAQGWARRILEASQQDPRALLLASAEMARSNPPLSTAFAAEFVQRLQERTALAAIPLTWMDHQLAELGTSLAQRVQDESWQQAANQLSVGASIGSLRDLDRIPWRDVVEEASHTEAILRQDPAQVYSSMDFATRDRYRHAVEDLARRTGLSEVLVATRVVALATAGADDGRQQHVGFYLVDRGLPRLLADLPGTPWGDTWRATHQRSLDGALYFGVIAVTTAGVGGVLGAAVLAPWQTAGPWTLLVVVGMALAASQLAVTLANRLAIHLKPPRVLPRLDFSEAIPDSARTLVVVPTLLTDLGGVEALLEALEVRYLGNRPANLLFGLLTDVGDAATATTPIDAALVEAARAGIVALNRRYDDGSGPRFVLLHRDREWNAAEGTWMGYERKRGKLEALNHLLRGRDRRPGATQPAFACVVADLEVLRSIVYVITLDTDTQLPRDAASKLIGTLAHPLNQPRFDPATRTIREGYGILQPRVGILLPATRRSWFVRLYAGDAGTDPYTHAVSDVYQDLFGEGSYVGKGIYSVDAFSGSLDSRFPENLVLSHDLIEGCYARSGLVSDVLLYEDHPSHYLEDTSRRRRWIRGDWQLLFWLLPWAPERDGVWRPTQLSWLSRWKLADNLRRSVVPVALLALALLGLSRMPSAQFLFGALITLYGLPALLASVMGGLRRPAEGVIHTPV